jgi:hypothetical protein
MKKYIEAVNSMSAPAFRLLRFCLFAVLLCCVLTLVRIAASTEFERCLLALSWVEDVQYILTSVSIAFAGATLLEAEIRNKEKNVDR